MKKTLFYFGCNKDKGHHLYDEFRSYAIDGRVLQKDFPNENISFLRYLDGVYPPMTKGYQDEGLYQEVNIGGFKILAWWDRSLDTRHASNSALIGYGYNTAEEMLVDFMIKYPVVAARQKVPVKYIKE